MFSRVGFIKISRNIIVVSPTRCFGFIVVTRRLANGIRGRIFFPRPSKCFWITPRVSYLCNEFSLLLIIATASQELCREDVIDGERARGHSYRVGGTEPIKTRVLGRIKPIYFDYLQSPSLSVVTGV